MKKVGEMILERKINRLFGRIEKKRRNEVVTTYFNRFNFEKIR